MSIFEERPSGGKEKSSPQGAESVGGDPGAPDLFDAEAADLAAAATEPVGGGNKDEAASPGQEQSEEEKTPDPIKKDRKPLIILLIVLLVLFGACVGMYMIFVRAPALRNVAVVNTPTTAPAVVSQATPTVMPETGNPTAAPTSAPTVAPTAKAPAFVWDMTFRGLATYYVDGDPLIVGFEEKGKTMKYVCLHSAGVFITMDPGFVQGVKTTHEGKEYGAVAYVPCSKGDEITFSTPHWSESALHQQVHLVELANPLPASVSIEQALVQLMVDDGKPLAYLFAADGTFKLILGDQLKK